MIFTGTGNKRLKGDPPAELLSFQNGILWFLNYFSERSLSLARSNLRPRQQFITKNIRKIGIEGVKELSELHQRMLDLILVPGVVNGL